MPDRRSEWIVTWPPRLFWKLFFAYAGLILATAVLFAALISAQLKQQVLEHFRERLRDDAVLLRSRLAAGRRDELQQLTRQLAHETGTRMTAIAADGTVLADSEQDPARMEPHGDRPEIAQAAAEGTGTWVHLSRTLGIRMMYFAQRVDDATGQPIGFVRVALPMQSVEQRVARTQGLVWGVALLVGVATLAVTSWVVARITQPLRSLTAAAEAITAGQYGHKVHAPSGDELGALADAFNRMSAELGQQVHRIRDDQALLTAVLGGMVEGVVAVDVNQRVLFANDAARTLLVLPPGDLAGRPIWAIVRHPAVQQTVQEALASERPCRAEFETASPARRTVALLAGRLHGEPPPGAVLVFHDVSELRRLETVRRDFVANVSHELKTPLSSIKAYAETLLAGALDEPQTSRAFVRQIEEQAERLHSLILDLLSLARIESGQEVFEIEPVAVAEVVSACVEQYAGAAAGKQLSVVVEPCSPMQVRADPEGLREILNNLLDNAIKYTRDGGRIMLRWRPDDSAGLIEIQDTGIGIPPHERTRIFERFYRVDKARSRELGGTGLGLSIVKHLVQAFGGSVSVSSEVGRGSTFTVRLPLAQPSPRAAR
jgi:two-component system phosphate regulon sensor histidine kinase PhoR